VDVHNYLVEHDAPHEVVPTRGRLRSAERIASVLDLPPDQVGKVVIFESRTEPIAAVVPAGREPDPILVGKAVRRGRLSAATDDRASELTEYLAESIPPAGLPNGFVVVLDDSLDRDEVLYFTGGEVRAVLKIRGKDLARATQARVAPIVQARRTATPRRQP
jgi:prolyl-tRNA editing enzyme YbaK/EbsC (Cys-tRNA(Pro) deacylase)